MVFDAVVRFGILHYDIISDGGSQRVSASYGGFTSGAQYHF